MNKNMRGAVRSELVGDNGPSVRPGDDPALYGTAELSPLDPIEARSYQTFKLTYTVGKLGIDDTGGIQVEPEPRGERHKGRVVGRSLHEDGGTHAGPGGACSRLGGDPLPLIGAVEGQRDHGGPAYAMPRSSCLSAVSTDSADATTSERSGSVSGAWIWTT